VSRWMKVCVLVALCIAGQPPVMATTATPGAASATASAQDVDPGHGCADTLVTYSVSLPPEATSWVLGIRATSESAVSGWTYFDSASGDPLAGHGSMQICSEGEREERTLTWTVDWTYVDQGDRIHTSDSGTGTTFVVNGVSAPSPFACPECDDTTTLGLRVVRKLDRVWVLKSALVWRKGSDSAHPRGTPAVKVSGRRRDHQRARRRHVPGQDPSESAAAAHVLRRRQGHLARHDDLPAQEPVGLAPCWLTVRRLLVR
jgi:hypothetical protein